MGYQVVIKESDSLCLTQDSGQVEIEKVRMISCHLHCLLPENVQYSHFLSKGQFSFRCRTGHQLGNGRWKIGTGVTGPWWQRRSHPLLEWQEVSVRSEVVLSSLIPPPLYTC